MRPSTVCPRERPRQRAANGRPACTRRTLHGWKSSEPSFRERRAEYSVEYRIVRPWRGSVDRSRAASFLTTMTGAHRGSLASTSTSPSASGQRSSQRVLVAELDHRVKNVLATVSAVAAQTLEASSSMTDFVAALDGRIRSMASTHELLSTRQWQGHADGRARPARARALRSKQQYRD